MIIADKQYLTQFNHITFGYVQAVNFYDLLGSNLILLTPCLNNSVNLLTSFLPGIILTTATKSGTPTLGPALLGARTWGSTLNIAKRLDSIRADC
jgi:hypothetical protein